MRHVKPRSMAQFLLGLCLTVLAFSAAASSDYYIKIGDIKGEATDADHKDWIIIESMSSPLSTVTQSTVAGAAPRDAASGLPSGKRQHKPVSVTKPIDKASPQLAGSSSVEAPRDAASGMPTGKRAPAATTGAEYEKSSPKLQEASASGAAGSSGDFSVHIRSAPERVASHLKSACASGASIKEATLGQRNSEEATVMHDVSVRCDADGSFRLSAKHHKTGHVTLMK